MMTAPSHMWRGAWKAALILVGLLILVQCDIVEVAEEERLVVEAFLPVGEPVETVTLRRTQSIGTADSLQAPVDDATVTLRVNGEAVPFAPTDAPGQYAPERTVELAAGDAYTFEAEWRGETARAEGTAPPPISVDDTQFSMPDNAPVEAVDVREPRRDSLDIPAEEGYIYPLDVTLAWDNADAPDEHWIHTQLQTSGRDEAGVVVDLFLQPEEVFPENEAAGDLDRSTWTGVYAVPVDTSDSPLPEHQLRVALIRGGDEYASFASTRDDPDRREPQSNINGALGIVAAVAVDTLRMDVSEDLFAP